MKVFLAYGFQRSTMDDIARAAEVSRPALYLLFKNKTDIYRALAAEFLAAAREKARAALEADVPLPARIGAMLKGALDLLQPLEESPHGAEILDMQSSLAGDIIEEWRVEMVDLIAEAIEKDARANGVDLQARGLSPRVVAGMLMDALDGMKARGVCVPKERDVVGAYVRIISLATRP